MAQIVVGVVESGIIASAIERLALVLKHEIQTGRARKLRSREYERLLEIIEGGPTYGAGLLVKLGIALDIKPMWEPLDGADA